MKIAIPILGLIILIGAVALWMNQTQDEIQTNTDTDTNTSSIVETTPQPLDITTENYEITTAFVDTDSVGAATVNAYIENEAADFKKRADAEMPDVRAMRDGDTNVRYTLNITVETYAAHGITSHVISRYEYTAGANGNGTFTSFTFKNSTQVPLSSLVKEEKTTQFLTLVKNALFEKTGFDPTDEKDVFVQTIHDLTMGDIEALAITENSIILGFSEYAVAPGAFGAFTIEIPWSAVSDFFALNE